MLEEDDVIDEQDEGRHVQEEEEEEEEVDVMKEEDEDNSRSFERFESFFTRLETLITVKLPLKVGGARRAISTRVLPFLELVSKPSLPRLFFLNLSHFF